MIYIDCIVLYDIYIYNIRYIHIIYVYHMIYIYTAPQMLGYLSFDIPRVAVIFSCGFNYGTALIHIFRHPNRRMPNFK